MRDRSERNRELRGRCLRAGVQHRYTPVRQPLRQQHGYGKLREHVLPGLHGAHARHRELRRNGVRSSMPGWDEAVPRRMHSKRQRLQRKLSGRDSQLRWHVSVRHQHRILWSDLLGVRGASFERNGDLQRRRMRHQLLERLQELPGDEPVRAQLGLLFQRQLHTHGAQHDGRLWHHEYVYVPVRQRIQAVRSRVHSHGWLLQQRRLHVGPSQFDGDVHGERVQLPVRFGLSRLQRNLLGQQQRFHLRDVLHGVRDPEQRHGDLQRLHLREHLQHGLSSVRRNLRGQQQPLHVWNVLHALRGAGQRHGDLQRNGLRDQLQQRLSPLRFHLCVHDQRDAVRSLLHGLQQGEPKSGVQLRDWDLREHVQGTRRNVRGRAVDHLLGGRAELRRLGF